MYDQPSALQLIEAAQVHLETNVIPALKAERKLYFQTLVAVNVLRVAQRELKLRPRHLKAEWARLNHLQEIDLPMPPIDEELAAALERRNRQLGADIRDAQYDPPNHQAALLAHLITTVQEQLEVSNPKFLQQLAEEDQRGKG
jgi:hypothetical protein